MILNNFYSDKKMDEYCTSVWYDSFFSKKESRGHITNHEIFENYLSVSLKLIGKR